MSESAPKISVVVPMYNAEKYLSLCINSILAQTFKDFELILIDDCSTDKTLEIAKSFSDSRIKILKNKKNLGTPGATRNVGIDAARGEYIFFCDDDDVILKNGLDALYNNAKIYNADVSTTKQSYWSQTPDFTTMENVKVTLTQSKSQIPTVSPEVKTRIYQELILQGMQIAPWNSLYRRKFLLDNGIRFPNEVAEDVFFNLDVVFATHKIAKIDVPVYIWRKHDTSTTFNPARLQKNMKSILALSKYIEEKFSSLNDANFTRLVLTFWINHVISSYIVPFTKNVNLSDIADEVIGVLKPRFGKDTAFVFTLMQLNFQGKIAIQENRKLKKKLDDIEKVIKA